MLSHDSVGRLCFLCWIPPGSSVQLRTAGDWQSWTVEDGLIHIAGSWCWLPHITLTSQEVLPAASHSGFWAVFQEDKGGNYKFSWHLGSGTYYILTSATFCSSEPAWIQGMWKQTSPLDAQSCRILQPCFKIYHSQQSMHLNLWNRDRH